MRPLWRFLPVMCAVATMSDRVTADPPAGGQRSAKLDTHVRVQMDYLLYLPKDYEKQESWPLVLFLHGSGERGDDLELVKVHGHQS